MYDDWGNEIAGPVDHMLLVDAVVGPTFLPSPTAFRDDVVWNQALALPGMDDLLFLLKDDDPFVLPTHDEHPSSNVKPGSDEDWLTPLSNEADLGEIVVPPPSPGTPSDPNSPFDPNGDNNPHDTNQGAYGDPTPPQNPDPYDACDDRKSDALADDINDEISRKPDSDKREYGALIWRDDAGNLHRTRLLEGNNFRLTELGTVNIQTLGINAWSQVVGIVHSHPTMIDTGTESNPTGVYMPASDTGRYDLMSGGDHLTADQIVNYGASRNNFTSYISYNGNVREFDYIDNMNESRTDTLGGRGVESNDYDPEAQCL